MKKLILSTVAVLAFGFANAQETVIVIEEPTTDLGMSAGNKWIEGAFSYSSTTNDNASLKNSFSFTPQMGYMLDDQWGVGGYLNLAGGENNNDDKFGSWGIGAFARYYFLSLGKHKSFQAFGEAGLGYSALTNNPRVGDSSTDNAFNARLNIGLNYFFTSNWAATFTLANIVSYNNASPENGDNTNSLNVNINLFQNIFDTPQFGLLYKW